MWFRITPVRRFETRPWTRTSTAPNARTERGGGGEGPAPHPLHGFFPGFLSQPGHFGPLAGEAHTLVAC